MRKKIKKYIQTWKKQGYPKDIPNEVPEKLMQLKLAPSYKAICFAILRNDYPMKSLGCTPKKSKIYSELKRVEILQRKNSNENLQQKEKCIQSNTRTLRVYFPELS